MDKESFKRKEHYNYEDLLALVRLLRDECPWDRVQTHESIRRCVIEEAYEVAEAIDRRDPAMMTEELGDLMMQVLFHADLAEDNGEFTLTDLYDHVCHKLIFRHPHVFEHGDASCATEEGWNAIKRKEKGRATPEEELKSIARTLPALTRAEKVAGKLADQPGDAALCALLAEQAQALGAAQSSEQAIGALLFTAAALAKARKIDPEAALQHKIQEKIEKNCQYL